METRWADNPSRRELEWVIRRICGGLKNPTQRFVGGGGAGGWDFE